MKAGDAVTLVGIPANLYDDAEMQTRALFQKRLGRSFVIAAVELFDGVPFPLAKIDVGDVLGKRALGAHHLGRAGIFADSNTADSQ